MLILGWVKLSKGKGSFTVSKEIPIKRFKDMLLLTNTQAIIFS